MTTFGRVFPAISLIDGFTFTFLASKLISGITHFFIDLLYKLDNFSTVPSPIGITLFLTLIESPPYDLEFFTCSTRASSEYGSPTVNLLIRLLINKLPFTLLIA